MTGSNTPVALVTGGARRVGAACCQRLHAEGFNVLIHFNHSEKEAKKLAELLNQQRSNSALAIQANLNRLEEIDRLARQSLEVWGRIDALLNNASTFYATPLTQANDAQWNDLINSNLKAPYFLSQKLSSALAHQNGSIINISDIFAEKPKADYSIYCIAKSGNEMMTKSLALELAPKVRVNGIAPGAILWPEDETGKEVPNPKILNQIPLQSLGGTQAICETVVFLMTKAHYITGEIIKVDGGRSVRL